jgi:predicted acylesterase/phospholipase RssA
MLDASSLLIAAFCGSSGGTMNTILYAMRNKLEIIRIDF